MSAQYTVLHKGQQFGPYPIEQITAMLQAGNIDATTLLWCDGWTEWVPVANVIPPQFHQPSVPIRTGTTAYTPESKRQVKSPNKTPWVIGASVILIVLLVGLYEYGRNRPQPEAHDEPQPAVSAVKSTELSDAKFTITRKSDDGGDTAWWEIVNQDHGQLIVNSVTFNGEFSASRGKWALFRAIPDTDESYPISIGNGETAYVMIYGSEGSNAAKYTKTITSVNIDTNRGKFHCRPGGLPQRLK